MHWLHLILGLLWKCHVSWSLAPGAHGASKSVIIGRGSARKAKQLFSEVAALRRRKLSD
jgi:hypothetical protein